MHKPISGTCYICGMNWWDWHDCPKVQDGTWLDQSKWATSPLDRLSYCARVALCPVCEGRGLVPAGFYYVPTDTSVQKCRRCNGVGTI